MDAPCDKYEGALYHITNLCFNLYKKQSKEKLSEMKKTLVLFVVCIFLLCGCGETNQSAENDLSFSDVCSDVVVETDSDEIDENPDNYVSLSDFTIYDMEEYSDEELFELYRESHEFSYDEIAHHMESTPDSTCFSEFGYSEVWNVLAVRFRDSGILYFYFDFPESEWHDFATSDSLGTYFNENIKSFYEYEKSNQ